MTDPTRPGGSSPLRPWSVRQPGRLIGRGHPAGDLLEAYEWKVIDEREGLLRVRAHVPARVKNLQGQLFGGFTPTCVDLVAICTLGTASQPISEPATMNMNIEYFEPIVGPAFLIESRLLQKRGRRHLVETRLFDPPGTLAVLAHTTFLELDPGPEGWK